MSTGLPGTKHRIQGIGDGFLPEIVKLDQLDDILVVDDGDAIIMANLLAKKLGLGVGISSGANFIGAVLAQNIYGKEANTITIFSDDAKKYLSSEGMLNETAKPGFISNDIELINVDAECICEKRILSGVCNNF
jgi:cysteine synthase A